MSKPTPPSRDLKLVAQFETDTIPRKFLRLYADKHGALLSTTLDDGREFEWYGILKGPSREI